MFSRAPLCVSLNSVWRSVYQNGYARGALSGDETSACQFNNSVSRFHPTAPLLPTAREAPSDVRENISPTLPRSPAMAIPPAAHRCPRPRRRHDTATDSDASARRRSITPSSATPTSRASSRLRGIGGATRGVALSATRVVTSCVVDGSAAQQQRSGANFSRAGIRRRACNLGYSRWNLPQTRNAPGATGENRVPNRRGPTHDMAKVSPRT